VIELDHLFVWTEAGAPEAELLVQFGLTEGEPNTHPGQGTACRRFFFNNAYLELLWVADPAEAQNETTRPTQLWTRSQRGPSSPFGVAFRPSAPGVSVPFPSWEYRPPYLPAGLAIRVGKDVPLVEPWWFYLDFRRKPQRVEHPAGFRAITRVRLTANTTEPSEVARAVLGAGVVSMVPGREPLAELWFDGGVNDLSKDFRPALPLVFRW
jgi:hypothetical protein